jgi:TonB family protein
MSGAKSSTLATILMVAVSLAGAAAFAQTDTTSEVGRKVKIKVAPTYPELARHMNIGGKVKLQVVISQDGRVTAATAIGGHPILVKACDEAVRKWKFQSAAEETTQIIEFEFSSSSR